MKLESFVLLAISIISEFRIKEELSECRRVWRKNINLKIIRLTVIIIVLLCCHLFFICSFVCIFRWLDVPDNFFSLFCVWYCWAELNSLAKEQTNHGKLLNNFVFMFPWLFPQIRRNIGVSWLVVVSDIYLGVHCSDDTWECSRVIIYKDVLVLWIYICYKTFNEFNHQFIM